MLGSVLHFTFELSGNNLYVGVFSAVNESVWEHLKLAFWPALLFMLTEFFFLKDSSNNFVFAKTVGVYLMVTIIPAVFYLYTAFSGESIFIIDILTFVLAVMVGQLVSYKLLTTPKLFGKLAWLSLILLVILAILFVVFTFYPPQIDIFKDSTTGNYGIH
jgi:hypothetical protein